MPALEVEGLRKRYGGLLAVDDISFEVAPGELFGILGPNGAGKTTSLEMIEGLRSPDAGRITILGLDAVRRRRQVQERIGVQLQAQALWPDLTVSETLRLFASLYRRRLPLATVLERVALADKARALVKHLSGGQKQRLAVATALVNDPDIVFLDEPTTGLDPQARLSFWELIAGMREEGKAVILTTHYMEEAEALCQRVAIMDHGRIIALGSPRELVSSLRFENTIEAQLEGDVGMEALSGLPAVRRVSRGDGTYFLHSNDVAASLAGLIKLAGRDGFVVQALQVRTATLEDVFISLTGHRLRD
jgi:ABC-2 type transport system ATP-binding protein